MSADGTRVATYAHLLVLDAAGARLPARMMVRDGRIALAADDSRARYPIVVDPVLATEAATLLATGGAADDNFGISVALAADGSRALVGAPLDDTAAGSNAGSARVFLRTGATWTEEATLLAPDAAANDQFGQSVALSADGSRALVGVPRDDITAPGRTDAGTARVFLRTGTTWTQEATLREPNPSSNDWFGNKVALSSDGSRALVGEDTMGGASAGAAHVFLRTGTTWTEEATLVAAGGNDTTVALAADGSRALVGAPWADGAAAGAGNARVFLRTGTTWTEEATLFASDGENLDRFGHSVALSSDGSRALIGVVFDDTGGQSGLTVGSARVFLRTGTTWTEEATLLASDRGSGDSLGESVVLSSDGSRALVGAPGDTTPVATQAGSARVFVRAGTTWTEEGALFASDGAQYDNFGVSVALSSDGSRALVGAYTDATPGGTGAGSARVFTLVYTVGDPNGTACTTGATCASTFCVDGVCCDTACGGNVAGDCQACSAAAGASANGTCAALSGRACDDGNACTHTDVCTAGACAGTAITCADDACNTRACNGTSTCTVTPLSGAACNDGNACTHTDVCAAGACAGTAITCTSDLCNTRACNGTSTCTVTPLSGTACNDGNACTHTDVCTAGACAGTAITCTSDACNTRACNGTATCMVTPLSGTACNDGNACTRTDTCQAGACTGSNPIACGGADACHDAVCNPATGTCTNPNRPDGTPCGAGCASTCQSGTCTGGGSVSCNPIDACHVAGVCNPTTGACTNPPAANGTSCNDNNPCTVADSCQAGTCVGTPNLCPADACHIGGGTCDRATGACNNAPVLNGTPCTGGTCQSGVCVSSDGGAGDAGPDAAPDAGGGGAGGRGGAGGAGGTGGATGGAGTSGAAGTTGTGGRGGATGIGGRGGAAGRGGRDGGADAAGGAQGGGGCGCDVSSGVPGATPLLLGIGLALTARARRWRRGPRDARDRR